MAPPSPATGDHAAGSSGSGNHRRPPGFLQNAMKRKGSFIQLFLMANVFFLSLRSLGQKYRAQELADENASLREERESLSLRMASVKSALLREADGDPTGALSAHLHDLFQSSSSSER